MSERKNGRWGECWISPSLVEHIDKARKSGDQGKTEDVALKILGKLREEGVPVEYLRHLKIDFVEPQKKWQPINRTTSLNKVQAIILEQFGTETARRVNIGVEIKTIHKL